MFETLTVTAVMEVSFEENVASRGFHVYGKEVWKSPNTVQKLSGEKEKNYFALKINPYSVAWKLKTKDKLIPVVVGQIPREISRFVSFFMDYDGGIEGVVLSPEFKASPISRGSLQIILRTRFTTAEEKSKYLHYLKELIKDYYEPITNLRRSKNGENHLNDMEQHSEEKQEEYEMNQVIFIDDESDEL